MIFVLLYHFACEVLHLVIRKILFSRFVIVGAIVVYYRSVFLTF